MRWKNIPPAPPMQMFWVGRDQDGVLCYQMPCDPRKPTHRLTVIADWIEHPEVWRRRVHHNIGSPDTRHIGHDNALTNRQDGMTDWKELWGAEKDKICLLLSNGPSLTKSIPEIETLNKRRDYFSLGANRTLRAFPTDYYVLTERRGRPEWVQWAQHKVKLIASTTANWRIARMFEHRWFGEMLDCYADCGMTRLSTGLGHVVGEAMFAAYKLGAKEVWCYGFDFSISAAETDDGCEYAPDKYYFDLRYDDAHLLAQHRYDDGLNIVRGINDIPVFISPDLVAYSQYDSVMAYMLERHGVKVVNKTPQGIWWHGRVNADK